MATEESAPAWSADRIGRRLRSFADELERELGHTCKVRRQWESFEEGAGGLVTKLIPSRTDALAVTWIDFGSGLQMEAGLGPGGFWELDERDDQAVEFIQSTVRAITAGRVSEVFGKSRSRVEVTYEDGSTDHETGYGICGILPQPGWRRRGRKVTYAPYR
ncbi:hypothetical protein ACWDWO_20580 [Actinopolymorpha singaporensis]